MKSEILYEKIESALQEKGFNLNGIWDKITYSSKMLLCERMVESNTWMNLPAAVICFEEVC